MIQRALIIYVICLVKKIIRIPKRPKEPDTFANTSKIKKDLNGNQRFLWKWNKIILSNIDYWKKVNYGQETKCSNKRMV